MSARLVKNRGLFPIVPIISVLVFSTQVARAEQFNPALSGTSATYQQATLRESVHELDYELLGVAASITALGFKSWNWGDSSSFHFTDEGWFGNDTRSGGIDKLGHAYAGYVISEFFQNRLLASGSGYDRQTAALHAALFSAVMVTYIEGFDGFTSSQGFSREDMVMNATGIGFSYLRGIYPGLADKLDFRAQYRLSTVEGFAPLTDYERQNFRLVLKPAGFDFGQGSKLRYLEFHLGYQATGFDRDAGDTDADRKRELFLGLSVNFDELFFKQRRDRAGRGERMLGTTLRYLQIPGTSLDAK